MAQRPADEETRRVQSQIRETLDFPAMMAPELSSPIQPDENMSRGVGIREAVDGCRLD
jgi:hypothetical protein